MERHDDNPIEPHLADALRRLRDAATVPPAPPAREAALLAAFDAGPSARRTPRRDYWYLSAFAAAAVVLLVVAAPAGRHGLPPGGTTATHRPPPSARDVRLGPPAEFVIVPGADQLPRMESGTLVRMDVPVSMLTSLGITPPPGRATVVTADLVVGQDGLPRAARLVN